MMRAGVNARSTSLLAPLLIILPAFIGGCHPKPDPILLHLPSTPILTSSVRWGVTNRPYLKLLKEPDQEADVAGLLRHGDIVKVVSKKGDPQSTLYWLEVFFQETETTGWTSEANLDVYGSPAQAQTARLEMLEN